jgi:hypothetical protein
MKGSTDEHLMHFLTRYEVINEYEKAADQYQRRSVRRMALWVLNFYRLQPFWEFTAVF